jgi:hypothetical protein
MSDDIRVRPVTRTAKRKPKLPDVVGRIVEKCDPARVMELYYWSREPGLLEVIRAIAAMPEDGREALESFFAVAGDPSTVAATWEQSGRLTLESNSLGEALQVIGYFLADPTGINRESEPN